jgi:hypothetical protein
MPVHRSYSNQNIFIPHGFSVAATVTSPTPNVIVTVNLTGPGIVPAVQATHPAAFNQTWQHVLAMAGEYALVVDMDFPLQAGVITVDMRVFHPAAGLHGVPWTFQITGQPGDFHTASYGLGVV